ncbi:MAG TPA: DUF4019 domain-containing protein [Candidatus Cybelea sp.]|nr:DUF4019 domain-containing protein [Candidatus Cybelea sp.]
MVKPGNKGRSRVLVGILFLAPLVLCSCASVVKDTALAKDAVGQFHSQLDAGQYTALYAAADPKLHEATTEAEFTRLLEAIHDKLGTVRQAELRTWNTGWYLGTGTTVTLVYNTTFSGGSGTEQFTWHVSSDRATLYGYHINSIDLIAK